MQKMLRLIYRRTMLRWQEWRTKRDCFGEPLPHCADCGRIIYGLQSQASGLDYHNRCLPAWARVQRKM